MRKLCFVLFAAIAVFSFSALPLLTTTAANAQGVGCLPGALKQRLAQIQQKFGSVRVISTHRSGARIAGSGRRSLHASCRAVDFHAPRGQHAKVVAWLKSTHGGGVGTYSCGMNHIHIDNGPSVRFHHCVGASGRPVAKFAQNRSKGRASRVASKPTNKGARRAKRVASSSSNSGGRRILSGISRQRQSAPPVRSAAAGERRSFSAQGHFADRKINGS